MESNKFVVKLNLNLPSESLNSTHLLVDTFLSSTEESDPLESSELDPSSDEDDWAAQKRDMFFSSKVRVPVTSSFIKSTSLCWEYLCLAKARVLCGVTLSELRPNQ